MAVIARSITFAFVLLGLTQASLFGCSSDKSAWYGKWEGRLHRTSPTAPEDGIKSVIDSVSVSILPDGTFQMIESGMSKSGTHNLGESKAFLRIQRIMGRPIDSLGKGASDSNRELVLEKQADGSLVLTDPESFDLKGIRLVRRSKPGS